MEEREEARARLVPLLDADTSGEFRTALANVDIIFEAIEDGTVDPYWGAVFASGCVSRHMVEELLASQLAELLFSLTDLVEFTQADSAGRRDAEAAIRSAVAGWRRRSQDDLAANAEFFARWASNCDGRRWRDRFGGPMFEKLKADGYICWPDE